MSQQRQKSCLNGRPALGEFREDDADVSSVLAVRDRGADVRGTDTSRASDYKPAACKDNTPHQIRMVKVAAGVELEVVDWGGSGKAMVLLTGLGDNAHVYDQFAFQFTDYFHVIGITRRGLLPSSQPETATTFPHGQRTTSRSSMPWASTRPFRRAFASRVGTERAGAEAWGARRKAGLSGCCRPIGTLPPSRPEPPGVQPVFTEATLKSLRAYQAASARYMALREPDPSACHNLKFNADGAIVDSTSPQWVTDKLLAGVAGRKSAGELGTDQRAAARHLSLRTRYRRQAWYWYLSPAEKAEFDEAWPAIAPGIGGRSESLPKEIRPTRSPCPALRTMSISITRQKSFGG